MNTVIFICNDKRITLVKEALQPLFLGKVAIVPDFDTGLKEVFEKRPPVVFIQHEISGVRGETVARHIKSLLQGNSPKFIHLFQSANEQRTLRDFDGGIDLNLPDQDLIDACKRQMEAVPEIRWKDQGQKPGMGSETQSVAAGGALPDPFDPFGLAPAPSEPGADTSFAFEFDEVTESAPKFGDVMGSDERLPELPPEPQPPECRERLTTDPEQPEEFSPPVPDAAVPAFTFDLPPSVSLPSAPPPPDPSAATSNIAWTTGSFDEELPARIERARRSARRSRILVTLAAGAAAVVLCGVMAYLFLRPSPPLPPHERAVPAPAAPATPPLPAVPVIRDTLPSFIPKEGKDAAYTAAHPGWERYVTPQREYLVYWERGVLRALQIIALRKGAVDDAFISAVLRELCGESTCMIASRSSREGYLVETGKTVSKAEVLIYRKKATGETRGVVITLP